MVVIPLAADVRESSEAGDRGLRVVTNGLVPIISDPNVDFFLQLESLSPCAALSQTMVEAAAVGGAFESRSPRWCPLLACYGAPVSTYEVSVGWA